VDPGWTAGCPKAVVVALGARLALPGTALPGLPVVSLPQSIPQTYKTYAEVVSAPPERLKGAVKVLVAREKLTGRLLAPAYMGPFEVIAAGPKAFKLRMAAKEDWVSVDRPKLYTGSADVPDLEVAAVDSENLCNFCKKICEVFKLKYISLVIILVSLIPRFTVFSSGDLK